MDQNSSSVFQFNPSLVADELKQSILQNGNQSFNNKSYYGEAQGRKESFSFDVIDEKTKILDTKKSDHLVHTKQYSENDVDMVQEVLNDMIQKEENSKDDLSIGDQVVLVSEPNSGSIGSQGLMPETELNLNGFDEDLVDRSSDKALSLGSNFSPSNSNNTSSSIMNDSMNSSRCLCSAKLGNKILLSIHDTHNLVKSSLESI